MGSLRAWSSSLHSLSELMDVLVCRPSADEAVVLDGYCMLVQHMNARPSSLQ